MGTKLEKRLETSKGNILNWINNKKSYTNRVPSTFEFRSDSDRDEKKTFGYHPYIEFPIWNTTNGRTPSKKR